MPGWAPRAHGSGREAYQTGARACPSLALKRSRVCALDFVLGVVAHGVTVARLVGDGVAVGVHPDAVRCVVAHGVKLLRS